MSQFWLIDGLRHATLTVALAIGSFGAAPSAAPSVCTDAVTLESRSEVYVNKTKQDVSLLLRVERNEKGSGTATIEWHGGSQAIPREQHRFVHVTVPAGRAVTIDPGTDGQVQYRLCSI